MKHLTTLTLIILFLYSCTQEEDKTFPPVKPLSEYKTTEFLPTLEHKISKDKNAVYCVTLLCAWDEIRKIINLPLQIDKNLQDLTLLNDSKSFVEVLKSNEYSTSVEMVGMDIKAKAEFNKSLPFEFQLSSFEKKLTFGEAKVASFGTFGYSEAAGNVIHILYYQNDDNFVILLSPTDKSHQIILSKSEKNFETMAEMFADVKAKINVGTAERMNDTLSWKYKLEDEDEVVIPTFKFNIETDYDKLVGNTFQTKELSYRIAKAWQRTFCFR